MASSAVLRSASPRSNRKHDALGCNRLIMAGRDEMIGISQEYALSIALLSSPAIVRSKKSGEVLNLNFSASSKLKNGVSEDD